MKKKMIQNAVCTTLLLVFSLCTPASADTFVISNEALSSEDRPIVLHIYQYKACSACEAIEKQLEPLQGQVSSERFVIKHHVLGEESAKQAFTQHQVTTLPEYVLLNEYDELLFMMRGVIDPERLVWEVQEALDLNQKFTYPEAYEHVVEEVLQNEVPLIVLFWSWDDKTGQSFSHVLMDYQFNVWDKPPSVLSFDASEDDVKEWMAQLGIAQAPAYLLVSPHGSILQVSQKNAQAWELVSDLNTYYRNFTVKEFETIPVELMSDDLEGGAIVPATLPTQPSPASGEIIIPAQ